MTFSVALITRTDTRIPGYNTTGPSAVVHKVGPVRGWRSAVRSPQSLADYARFPNYLGNLIWPGVFPVKCFNSRIIWG